MQHGKDQARICAPAGGQEQRSEQLDPLPSAEHPASHLVYGFSRTSSRSRQTRRQQPQLESQPTFPSLPCPARTAAAKPTMAGHHSKPDGKNGPAAQRKPPSAQNPADPGLAHQIPERGHLNPCDTNEISQSGGRRNL